MLRVTMHSKLAIVLLCGVLVSAGTQQQRGVNLPYEICVKWYKPYECNKPAKPEVTFCKDDLDCRTYIAGTVSFCNLNTFKCQRSLKCNSFNDCLDGQFCSSKLNQCIDLYRSLIDIQKVQDS